MSNTFKAISTYFDSLLLRWEIFARKKMQYLKSETNGNWNACIVDGVGQRFALGSDVLAALV
ncbi:uncharacterized protein PpBr36_06542 [Pyricularia pennisetigena]|uniref:uncharacterized protein n=1 Tax=Pyricularia pennisetigena TaxID=1578925 RepID=UPI001154E151|nr:uncharacterized protein PpBr36_06542 [Pyricularia pennisetigena]TLS23506.1 hypothetical protein PpBr36_06542 [Pyricularia pennisetigena]